MSDLRKIGIVDISFRLATVEELIAEGILERPMDGNHGEQHPKVADYVSEGIPFIMANDLVDGKIDYGSCSFIAKKQADGLRKGFAKPGDVLVTHKATIGRTALVGDEAEPYIMLTPQVTYYRIKNRKVLDNRYLRHYFGNQFFQKTLAIWAGAGATRAYLGITDQRKLPIIVPPYLKQRKIAAILTTYEDLIETNKRRIALLEKMAEELYREWFVRMRFPGHQNTKFVKGVPETWEVKSLGDLGTYLNGFAFKPSHWGTEGIPIIKIKEMNSGVTGETPRNSGDDIPSKYHFDDGAIIFSWSGTLLVMVWDQGPGLLNQHLFKVDPKQGVPHGFLFLALSFSIPLFEVLTTGATMQHIKRKELSFVKVKVPPPDLLNEFNEIVEPILESKLRLTSANRTLAQTRDLLLPRLISGKLAIEGLDIQFPLSMQEEAAKPEPTHA